MQNNSQNFSMQDMMRIAQSPTGRQLLSLLQQGNRTELEKASKLAATGNIKQAKEILQQIQLPEDVQSLIKQLGEQNG